MESRIPVGRVSGVGGGECRTVDIQRRRDASFQYRIKEEKRRNLRGTFDRKERSCRRAFQKTLTSVN